jgi:hypothetical protein
VGTPPASAPPGVGPNDWGSGVSWVEIIEVRGGRNWLRLGDRVHVNPTRPRRHDGFDGRVTRLLRYPDGHVEVEVRGGRNGRAVTGRTVVLDRVRRRVQTRNGDRIGGTAA